MKLAARMARLGTESAFAVLAQAQALERTGRTVVHLEIGEPDFPTPPHIVEAAAEALRAGYTHYVPAPGMPMLREAVSAFLEQTGRLKADPDRVVITPGSPAAPSGLPRSTGSEDQHPARPRLPPSPLRGPRLTQTRCVLLGRRGTAPHWL